MITVENLTAGYGKLEILQDLSLSFAAGQFSAVLGPNGSGKSTLMKAVMGVNRIFAGSIRLETTELVGMPTEAIAGLGLAYVPQRENIFDELTVLENLQLGCRSLSREERTAALRELLERFPILGRRQTQRAVTLSGGEHQMLAIAIGWLSRPRIMLLDEPSAGLAPARRQRGLRRIAGAARERDHVDRGRAERAAHPAILRLRLRAARGTAGLPGHGGRVPGGRGDDQGLSGRALTRCGAGQDEIAGKIATGDPSYEVPNPDVAINTRW